MENDIALGFTESLRMRTAVRSQSTGVWRLPPITLLDLGDFRAVHACWHDPSIVKLRAACPGDRLTPELLVRSAEDGSGGFKEAVETVVKGPETQVPDGYGFNDNVGHFRTMVRLDWCNSEATDWKSITAAREPMVVGQPMTTIRFLSAIGMPCSGPRRSPAARRRSSPSATFSAASIRSSTRHGVAPRAA